MPQKDPNKRNEPPEDQDVIGWFNMLDAPRVAKMPPHLRANVKAQIEKRRAGGIRWGWTPLTWPSRWNMALATALLLSLGINIWWGAGQFGVDTLGHDLQQVPTQHTYRFQADMQNPEALGTFVTAHSPVGQRIISLGFSPQDTRVTMVRMGILYADALAALHGGAHAIAGQRLSALMESLDSLAAPRALSLYLNEMQTLLRTQRYADAELAKFLALFESLYEHDDVRSRRAATMLFRLGAWLENMALAAAAGDQTLLKQTPIVRSYQKALRQLDAPPEALQAFEQIDRLVAQQTLTAQDFIRLHKLVVEIQRTLGGMPDA